MKKVFTIPTIKCKALDNCNGIIRIEGVSKAYSNIISMGFRHGLLEAVPGFAPTGYSVGDRVSNTNIPNIIEDPLKLSKNISDIIVGVDEGPDEKQYIEEFTLSFFGPCEGELKLKDFTNIEDVKYCEYTDEAPSGIHLETNNEEELKKFKERIRLVNPEHVILTVGKLEPFNQNVRIRIKGGTGHLTTKAAERHEEMDKFVIVESNFNHVLRVNNQIEKGTSTDTVVISVTTDGAVDPFHALEVVRKDIETIFFSLNTLSTLQLEELPGCKLGEDYTSKEANEPSNKITRLQGESPIENLVLESTVHNALKLREVNTVDELIELVNSDEYLGEFVSNTYLDNLGSKEEVKKYIVDQLTKAGITNIVEVKSK